MGMNIEKNIELNVFQRGILQKCFIGLIAYGYLNMGIFFFGIFVKKILEFETMRNLFGHALSQEKYRIIVQFIDKMDPVIFVPFILFLIILFSLARPILLRFDPFLFVQNVNLPHAFELTSALKKYGVVDPDDQIQFLKKHKLDMYRAQNPIVTDEANNIRAKLCIFPFGYLASRKRYLQNIGARKLCLNACDLQPINEQVSSQSAIALNELREEIKVNEKMLSEKNDRIDQLQQENDELKRKNQTFEGRIKIAKSENEGSMAVGYAACCLSIILRRIDEDVTYTTKMIKEMLPETLDVFPDLKRIMQNQFGKEIKLTESHWQGIKSLLLDLCSDGGRPPKTHWFLLNKIGREIKIYF